MLLSLQPEAPVHGVCTMASQDTHYHVQQVIDQKTRKHATDFRARVHKVFGSYLCVINRNTRTE
jgi:hypothetical protein